MAQNNSVGFTVEKNVVNETDTDKRVGLTGNTKIIGGSVSGDASANPSQLSAKASADAEVHGVKSELNAGRWLAFEYNELNDPDFPKVGIMRLGHGSHAWRPILKGKPGRHLYVGDFSWSPDSRWLALMTDYPDGTQGTESWLDLNPQVVKLNVDTGELVRLTDFPARTILGPATAWLRSGLIVFTGPDGNIYGVPENGGDPRKLIDVPEDKCGGVTNTLASSPDEQRIVFEKDSGDESQTTECNALWIGDLKTKALRRLPTTGLRPLNPFWLDEDTVLFSGIDVEGGKWSPAGIYRISLGTGEVSPVLKGLYGSPFVCDSGKTLYFSWGPKLRTKSTSRGGFNSNDHYDFHIWKIPLRDVMDQKIGNGLLKVPGRASDKSKQ